ncbi:MAG: hypothetical protein PHF60_05150 [Candidatus ainarchaeum sp.]|nr:hypothetical protein [Candidatus ainarchaeum sp.]
MAEDMALTHLDRAWKSTCKIVLGDEIGDLLEYRDYLKRYTDPMEVRKSSLSGVDVTISSGRFSEDARFLSNSEAAEYDRKLAAMPLDINSIKDLDSLVEAVSERVAYAGNIVLGNSSGVLRSHRVVNTHYALECQDIYDGKYVAYASSMRCPEYFFGGGLGGNAQFCIKSQENYKMVRCMETMHINVASDCYYSTSLENCSDCIFSFNQRSKHFLIGNLPLPKDKYLGLKGKLLAEIRDTLERDKSLVSIAEIVAGASGVVGARRTSAGGVGDSHG